MLDVTALEFDVEQLQAAGTSCWLLKDLGWVLLLPQLSWTAALLALWIELKGIIARWTTESEAERLHGISVFLWLAGNAVWMTTEMLFESSPELGRRFPWFHGPLSGIHEDAARWGVQVSQACFVAALAVILPFYVLSAYRWAKRLWCASIHDLEKSMASSGLVLGGLCTVEVYQMAFVGPWVLKDLFWTVDWLLPSLPCALLVLVMMMDYVRRFRTATFVAELFWVIGNTVWIIGELWVRDDSQHHRWLAGAILFSGNVVALLPLRRAFDRVDRIRSIEGKEGVPLYGWKGKLRGSSDRSVSLRPVRVV